MLRFPTLDALELALRSGMVPADVSDTPALAVFEPGGAVRVEPSQALGRAASAALKKVGVASCKRDEFPDLARESVHCWPQLVPLKRDRESEAVGPTTPVLFDLPGALLPELSAEIFRLGNDRQSVRWLSGEGGAHRALLRVVGPPYYALLRAIDRGEGSDGPRAYVEQTPHVWVELGHAYPLADRLRVPPGRLLLVGPPRRWEFLEEGPFRDVYEVAEFGLPAAPIAWQATELAAGFRVPVRLARGGAPDPAELWVVRGAGLDRLNDLVQHADDRLLSRLAFAVATDRVGGEGGPTVVLRVRPSKLAPPVLVLDATAYRPYMRLPNLFLPVGTRLHPPLRRDAVSKLLAADPDRLTWLTPTPGDPGSFTPEGLPEDAFRPLDRWVDHVVDRDGRALDAWVGSARFEFDEFVCDEEPDRPDRPKGPPPAPRKRAKNRPTGEDAPGQSDLAARAAARKAKDAAGAPDDLAVVEPGEAVRRLTALESDFLTMETPLDDPGRAPVWSEMAGLNAALGRQADAAVCWANALWEAAGPEETLVAAWSSAERRSLGRGAAAQQSLDALLSDPTPTSADVRALAVRLLEAAAGGKGRGPALEQVGRIQGYLERNETLVAARVGWLAWTAVAALSGGDALALARARDRLLERLHQQGLNRDVDLPSFLRYGGGDAGGQARRAGEQLVTLHEEARRWVGRGNWVGPHTRAFCELMFAFGAARVGDAPTAKALLQAGLGALPTTDGVCSWLGWAFDHRVRQALEGKAAAGPLPDEMMSLLDEMGRVGTEEKRKADKTARYKIDRLREHSRILEPHEKVSPYRHWRGSVGDAVAQELAGVVDLTDRAAIRKVMDRLLSRKASGAKAAAQESDVLGTALEVAYRLGEPFARGLFPRVLPAVDSLDQITRRARLLERATQLAAHFDQPGYVRAYVERFEEALGSATDRDHNELEPLLRECFRGLRKVGLRDEIDRLLGRMAEAVGRGRAAPSGPPGRADAARARATRLLLHVAAGWCYFGQPERARPVFDDARALLLGGALPPIDQTALACVYARSLGQAPAELALPRLLELFTALENVHDTFTVGSHYSLSRLDLIEAVVLTIASDDFTAGEEGRRWVEDDEYLVRRRVHRDVRAALGERA